ncbi:MAG: PIN domain-containing protein, partial [Bacteroidales bacterium]
MTKKKRKIFILDTNVLLHDYKCIFNFQENDIIIPITVLEELDKFKKGNDLINYHAREFTRELDRLSGDGLFNGGISLGEKLGKLSIETGKVFSEKMNESFPENTPDHRILAIAEHVFLNRKDREVVLITKDINLRMKAKSIGVMAGDYESDKVQNIDKIYKEIYTLEDIADDQISGIYNEEVGISIEGLNISPPPKPNQYFILKGNRSSALVHYNSNENIFERVVKQKVYGIEPRNA